MNIDICDKCGRKWNSEEREVKKMVLTEQSGGLPDELSKKCETMDMCKDCINDYIIEFKRSLCENDCADSCKCNIKSEENDCALEKFKSGLEWLLDLLNSMSNGWK